MKVKITYPGQEERIVDAPPHIEKYLREGKDIPFNAPYTGTLTDDHGKTLVYLNGQFVAIQG